MNRRGFLRNLLAGAAVVTGLARVRLDGPVELREAVPETGNTFVTPAEIAENAAAELARIVDEYVLEQYLRAHGRPAR